MRRGHQLRQPQRDEEREGQEGQGQQQAPAHQALEAGEQLGLGLPADQFPARGADARGLDPVALARVGDHEALVLDVLRDAVRQHVRMHRAEHAALGQAQFAHRIGMVAARQHMVVVAQQHALARAAAAELAHQRRQVAQRQVADHHQRLQVPPFPVEPLGRLGVAHAELLAVVETERRRPHRRLAGQRLAVPGALGGVVVAAEGFDARGREALARIAALDVDRALVCPGLGAEGRIAHHLADRRHRVALGHQQMAVVAGHAEAVELGRFLEQGPQHLGTALAVLAQRMQARRIADGMHHRLGLGEEGQHVVLDAVMAHLVRRLADARHQPLRAPVAERHQQQRLDQRDGADDGADVDPEAPHARGGRGFGDGIRGARGRRCFCHAFPFGAFGCACICCGADCLRPRA